MKTFALFVVLLMVLSCSDSEKPRPIILEPEPVQPKMAEFFVPFQDTLNDWEYNYLLEQTSSYCNNDISEHTFHANLKYYLQETSYERLIDNTDDIELIPASRNEDKDLIKVALWFGNRKLQGVAFEPKLDYVYMQFTEHMYIMVLNTDFDESGRFIGRGTSLKSTNPSLELNRSHLTMEENHLMKDIASHVVETWMNKGIIDIPLIPSDLDLTLLIVDETGKPVDAKFEHLAIPLDKAPRATARQLARYNSIHSPEAYDCIEDD